ncbi:MAG: succinate dehydrogenase/fumarate reductase iron-sulfur subunit [Cyanobacteria bacterium SID2]|nr:succinate dehydrogenase/fumarate reductase iron-sulfur subunit [Cyanobacteria bacterium SID2]MBP0003335.1 succinate dehydrogenase/fumarate reductase iron-sulfur subunit [Cyanobacteria bacterium SBC]
MHVQFQIVRQTRESAPRFQTYTLDVEPGDTILTCLDRIKWEQDGSLAFRKNCRNTICGSCSMRINGRSALACKENVGSELQRVQATDREIPTISIAPMGNMPVIKDLVVDMKRFWDDLDTIDPYVSTNARRVPEREFLQSPEEREQFDNSGNCILCGACYSECNALEVNPDFVGPHALAKAQRLVFDSRDDRTETRLEQYNQSTSGVWGCTRCYYCNSVCPMEVAPLDRISQIKGEILARTDRNTSIPIRHRKVLVDLVREGGWVDERKFGFQVVGNYFRDLKGLLSLVPLGWRMLTAGKLPLSFEASEGTQDVRSLIDNVRQVERETDRSS